MSDVKMCDKCGDIFSVLEEGWTISSQTRIDRDENDRPKTVSVNIDLCPECSPNTKKVAQDLKALRKVRRTATLELMAGVRDGATGREVDPIERQLHEIEQQQDGGA